MWKKFIFFVSLYIYMCVCVCVCVCARARACVCVCKTHRLKMFMSSFYIYSLAFFLTFFFLQSYFLASKVALTLYNEHFTQARQKKKHKTICLHLPGRYNLPSYILLLIFPIDPFSYNRLITDQSAEAVEYTDCFCAEWLGYDTKPSNGEAPVLGLCSKWNTSSLYSSVYTDPKWLRSPSMSQIELFNHLLYLKSFDCMQTNDLY